MKRKYFIGLILLLAASSCSVRRFLPAGEKLYKGSKIIAWVIIALLVGGAALYVVESGMLTSSPATAGKEYPRGM